MAREAREQGSVNKGEDTMARNLQISLAARVQEASAGFRKKQSTYLKSELETWEMQCLITFVYSSRLMVLILVETELRGIDGMVSPLERSSSPVQNQYTDPSLIESDADKSYSQSALQQTAQQQLQLGSNDAAIAQREREINDIANGIIELSDIFRELQTMIIDQGTMLDRIDFNVERMALDVKGADKELKVVCLYPLYSTKTSEN